MNSHSIRKRVLFAAAALLALAVAVVFPFVRGAARPDAEDSSTAPGEAAAAASRPGAGARAGRVVVPAAAQPTPAGSIFFQAGWGSGEGQLGRLEANESNPEAPMSLTVDRQGNVYVLDQVNGRIVRLDKNGQPLPPLPVTQQVPRDLVASPTGGLVVMDNLRDNSVAVLGPDGQLLGELPVVGKNVDRGGLALGIHADSSGVYLERENGMTVRVGDAAGTVDAERPVLDGRPSRDGASLLSMAVIQVAKGRFWVRSLDRASGQMKFMREFVLATPILHLSLLDSDAAGRIYAAANVAREEQDPATGDFHLVDQSVQLLCLSPGGELQRVLSLPPNRMAHESVRDLTVRDDGVILYMHRDEEGVRLLQYACG
ncbi:MAG TPA: hypothetical protein VE153_22670 [Myxococcus sp.]|nr:hypothetical protein [Myxococcus sp.]